MKYISMPFIIVFILLGCSSETMQKNIDKVLIASSGNKPPKLFAFASPYRANGYIMQGEEYSFMMPLAKGKDWKRMGGWDGMSDFQGIGIYLNVICQHVILLDLLLV